MIRKAWRKIKQPVINRLIKVNTFIIGVQKGGTSSLFDYLIKHPMCSGGYKELHFFDTDKRYYKGDKWYHSQLPENNRIVIDASPSYIYRRRVPERIKAYNPEAKFIVLLRDPVQRAYSAWNMYREMYYKNREGMRNKPERNHDNKIGEIFYEGDFPSFEETVEMELTWIKNGAEIDEPAIIRRGFYYDQINEWLKYFKRNQFLFLISEEFKYLKSARR